MPQPHRTLHVFGSLAMPVLLLVSEAHAEDELEVTVAGDAVERHSSRDAAAASTVLRRGDLESPGADAAYELARAPGVQVQRSGGGSDLATASIRGTSSTQTPVYLAGIRLNDDLSGTADLSTIPLWMLDRIEIFRGHAPLGLETAGIGGAILFEPRYPKGPELRGGLTLGSWAARSVYGAAGQGSSRASALFAVRRESADNDYGYRDNAGTAYTTADDRWVSRRNAQQTTTDVWALGRVALSNSSQLLIMSNGFERSQGITGLFAVPAEHAHATISRELFGVSSRTAFRCWLQQHCEVSTATSFQRATVLLDDPAYELGLGATSLDSRANRVTQRIDARWPVGEVLSFGTLFMGGAETLSVVRPAIDALDSTRHSGLLGLSSDFAPLTGVHLLGTARLESEATRSTIQARNETHPTGRIGAALEPLAGLALLGNFGLYARTPTLGELYGTSAFVAGNSTLQAERGTNWDVGARLRRQLGAASLALETFAFRQDIDKLVGWHRSSFGQIKPYNIGKARLQGLETSLGLDLWSMVHIDSAVTLLDSRDLTPSRTLKNDILPFRSRLVIDTTLELRTRRAAAGLGRASVFLKGAHRGSRYQDPAGLIIIPHATTFDTGVSVGLKELPITLRATIYNLFDATVFDIVGYPLPPRTAMFGAELAWEHAR